MIKPRRLLLLVLGFFVCFGAYEVYSYFLGHYDGLPPLPPEYRYNASAGPYVPKPDDNDNRKHEIAKLLERAFGPKCPELTRFRSVEIGRPESRTVLAFDEWTLEDGVLRLTEVSLANFKIIPPEGKLPAREEITTVQGKVAVIKFNQPIKSPFEIKSNVKPIEGHIEGDVIKLTHNHGTPEPNDDITMYCDQRVDFVDEQKRIWCDHKVQVVYAFPEEARFVGVGLTIKLANELVPKEGDTSKNKGKGDKPEGLGISAVKSIQLEREVQFSFFKLNGSILGGAVGKPDDKPVVATQQLPAQPMVIRCKDAFTYDVPTNVATFNTNVNGLRHRTVAGPAGPKQQYDELDADEKLVLELLPPNKSKSKMEKQAGVDESAKQFELKKAVATGKKVKITANEDGQGNGLHAEGIELIVDNVAHEARLRGKDQVVAHMMEYDIIAQGAVKILLPASDAEDKDPCGLLINGPGEVRLRPSIAHPDPYTLASWQRELQWHRTLEEHRIELYGNAVLMHEKQGRMSGEQVKAWLVSDKKKLDEKPKPAATAPVEGADRLNAKLKRVEVDQKVQVLSTRLVIPSARRLTLNFTEAPAGFVIQNLQKPGDGFDTPAPAADKNPGLLGKPEAKVMNPPPNSPPLYLHAAEIDGDILLVGENQQVLRRLEARENVHIERKPDPGKQNGIDIQGQRLEMSLQGNTDLYRVKLFGKKAIINNEKYGIEGQSIDLDQAENMLTIDGAGKFRFYTDKDFQGNLLVEGRDAAGQPLKDTQGNIRVRPEQVTFVWNDRMKFGGRVAEFTGSVIAEKGDINLSCHSMTITLDKPMSLSGKDDGLNKQPNDQVVAMESVICNSLAQGVVGQRVNPVVIEQRIKPGTADRNIIRIEGVQVVFDNSTKNKEIFKVFGPGEVNIVRAGQNQLFNAPNLPGAQPIPSAQKNGANQPPNNPLELKLTRILFEQEAEYIRVEGKLTFWRNVRFFHVPGDDVAMPLDEKRMPKQGIFIGCDRMEVYVEQGPNGSALHEARAEGNTEMRANLTSYVKADELTYNEAKGKVVMRGKGANDALYYNQEKPGGQFLSQRAKAFIYDLKTGILEVEQAKSLQIK
ncbi:MAG: hypothetical protein QM703_00830 [Gemmatales bacterium]